ncbi:MAPK regulated corepressor interacting protein 2-like [Drosophila pseudoobscura]|uniref:MAPK regulated corepressor interacting protein 2-like n=1 Tax=Drosophila pseudoobscura pseudoobscura TaxID=46245 RepID=A0A6I8V1F5_DROPS|nr:MAPK regulated corepressor interacting protein 2 [Drosophila pseudoobscura]
MYNIKKRLNQIVGKKRSGLARNIESLDSIKPSSKKKGSIDQSSLEPMEVDNIPRPDFRRRLSKHASSTRQNEHEMISSQDEDIINFINDSWNQLVTPNPSGSSMTANNTIGSEESILVNTQADNDSLGTVWIEPPSPELANFKPFDLESWWSRRLLERVTKDI